MLLLTRMRRWIFAFVILLALPSSVQAQESPVEKVTSFVSDITVQEDGDLFVQETISVYFPYEKHGLYRYVPFQYASLIGWRAQTPVTVVRVLQDGGVAQVEEYEELGNLVWKIGDPDVTLQGDHVYVVEYAVENVLRFPDEAELYWNVTGNDWDMPLENVRAVVRLPGGALPETVMCFTGAAGSEETCVAEPKDGAMVFSAADTMTIKVGFDAGVVARPNPWGAVAGALWENVLLLLWWALLPVPFALWVIYGRDPRVGALVAEYAPPKGMLPAQCAAMLWRYRHPQHLLAAMIVTLAQKGHLRIHAADKETVLEQLTGGATLDAAHALLRTTLFRYADGEGKVHLGKAPALTSSDLEAIRRALRTQLVEAGYYTTGSFHMQTALMTVGIVASFFAGFMALSTENVAWLWLLLDATLAVVFSIFMPRYTPEGLAIYRKVLGFRRFMHTAERYRSAWHERESMFTEYLAYAIAFHDVHRWAKAFGDVDQMRQPGWYVGTFPRSSLLFADSLTRVVSTVSASMPRSSGSSSGGSSGGGFGGGGGGSW